MLRIYFTLLALVLMALGVCAQGEEPPERHFKPYPVKKIDPTATTTDPAKAVSGGPEESESKITGPTSLTTYKPFGVEPVASLKAHPPTSGKEPMLTLGAKNKPFTEPVFESDKLSYYDCEGIVAPWFQELVTAEMNYFNELVQMPMIRGNACVVGIYNDKSLTPGKISLQFFGSVRQLNDCVRDEVCPVFRSVTLLPKKDVLYRSYFLSDMARKLISQQCVTAKGKLFTDTSCYSVD